MKEKEYLAFGYLLAMAVIIPWSNALTNLLMAGGVLFIIQNIITNKKRSSETNKLNKVLFALVAAFVMLVLINILANKDYTALKYLARIATIILLPTMIYVMAIKIPHKQKLKVLQYYVHSVFALSLGTIVVAFSKTLLEASTPFNLINLTYFELSNSLVHHEPIYFSIMVGAAILFGSSTLYINKINEKSIIYYIELVFLLLFLFLLGSRTAIVSTFIGLGILAATKSRKLLVYLIISFSLLFLMNYKFNSSFQSRVDHVVNFSKDFDYQNDWSYEGLALRYMTWNCSFEGIKENFMFGTGISEAQTYLNNCYKENKYESLLYFNRQNGTVFNSHNTYLDVFLKFGIFGMVILATILILLILSAIKNRNTLLLITVTFFMLNGLTESILVREKGIIFFSFFLGLFLCFKSRQNQFNTI
ncbi:O-antigen ligase family protein [Flagellimonas sp. GZD32]|uniref:O-antigen ligase family protein n=1 Tax=Flagellimonas cixiensis TaxID=3228750 RepID=UPI0035C8C852